MPKAIWNGAVIAESDDTVVVEGNHYFPADSVNREYLVESDTHTVCPWKGTASYFTIEVEGQRNEDAAWFYPTPEQRSTEGQRPDRLLARRAGRRRRGRDRSRRWRHPQSPRLKALSAMLNSVAVSRKGRSRRRQIV